jgi:hypothetical protein
MLGWKNWGVAATVYGANCGCAVQDKEDFAEAVMVYFYPNLDEDRLWTDDIGAVFTWYPWLTGPDQLMLDEDTLQPSQTGTVQVYDRYDWLECRFTGNCLKPL